MILKVFKRLFAAFRAAPENASDARFEEMRDQGTKILQSMTQPDAFPKLELHLRRTFSLYHRWSADRTTTQLLRDEISAAERVVGLARVFMFHGDGRVREVAINHLHGPLIAPASVYALFWRLNDWSPVVRAAALKATKRCLPVTPAVVVAPALKALLPHIASWGRWGQAGPDAVNTLLMRQDVAGALLRDIVETRQSGLGLLLRELCRNPWMDQHLTRIAEEAALPHLRFMAFDALISGTVRWPARERRKIWIDRSLGKYRYAPAFHDRDLTVERDVPALLLTAAQDRSSMVRKRAADGLIALRGRRDLAARLAQIAHALEHDKNIGVQGRMAFLHRKCAEEGIDLSVSG